MSCTVPVRRSPTRRPGTPTGAVDFNVDAGNSTVLAQDVGAEDGTSSEG
jgi:hypothetical protein